jgi:vacuolar-type H+-ATPase subunit C/Vma6
MQKSILYANANISMQISAFLLTRDKIRTMTTADSIDDIKSILSTCGYKTDFETDDEIIETERAKTVKTATDLCTDPAVIRCIEILNGRHEIRKKLSAQPNLTSFELDILCEIELFGDLTKFIPKIKNKNIKNYFVALADLTNIKTVAKYRLAGIKATGVFVDGGIIEIPRLISASTGDPETLKGIFSSTPYQNVHTALDKALNEKDLNILENAIYKYMDDAVAVGKDDIFRSNLLFWWFIKKQAEFIVVKTIMMNRRLNLPPDGLREQLRGLYERFN